MQRVNNELTNDFERCAEPHNPGEELHIEDIIEKTPENETPRMVKNKYESSEKMEQDEQTPKNLGR